MFLNTLILKKFNVNGIDMFDVLEHIKNEEYFLG